MPCQVGRGPTRPSTSFRRLGLVQVNSTHSAVQEAMALSASWWILALLLAVTAPLWTRVLVDRAQRKARARTERLLARMNAVKHTLDEAGHRG